VREDNRLIATLCVVLMLSMTGFMPLAAVLPALFVEFSLGETEAGWLTGAYFGGYAASVPFLTAWTDRVDARRPVSSGARSVRWRSAPRWRRPEGARRRARGPRPA